MLRLRKWMEDWSARRQQRAEIARMSQADFAELGMSRETLLRFIDFPRDVRARMQQMAAVFGADFRRVERDRGSFQEMTHACGTCAHRGACARELACDDGTTPERCGFCPNAEAYRDLATPRAA